jgi:hypothetical protein
LREKGGEGQGGEAEGGRGEGVKILFWGSSYLEDTTQHHNNTILFLHLGKMNGYRYE